MNLSYDHALELIKNGNLFMDDWENCKAEIAGTEIDYAIALNIISTHHNDIIKYRDYGNITFYKWKEAI